ncbi:MAG: glycosyltransferase family 9 protein [bacterium]
MQVLRGASESTFYLLILPFILVIKKITHKLTESEKIITIERILRIGDTITAMPAIGVIENKYGRTNVYRLIFYRMKPLVNLLSNGEKIIYWKEQSFLSFLKQTFIIRKMGFQKAYILVTDRMSAIFAMLTGIPHTIGYDYNRRGAFLTEPREPPDFINRPAFVYKNNTEVYKITNVWLNLIDRDDHLTIPTTKFRLKIDSNDVLWSENRIGHLKRPIVIFHPSSRSSSKLWFKERWINIGEILLQKGYSVVITGNRDEEGDAIEISHHLRTECVVGETDIPKLIALIERVDYVITIDTAIGHISAIFDKPTIVLFGPSDERIWKPDSSQVIAIRGNSDCAICKKSKCFQKERYCMKAITVEMVLKSFFKHHKIKQ